ncbi:MULTISPECIES: DUF4280 domain-containing protein [Chryseobacterium]|uniref:DUF4280 domain-containing protein n=1 Tax=Chryseobacterium TaxID=59732 RepID=UPI002358303E|nr:MULTISPECIES: DUF4280 domain-containing protein [unclassified Chryseobacterium]MDC8106043.1 DUF4280 domain-containing protein [Chryseobacterium sp. B21-037]MDQ1804547.1 DUF4280 domain-containing protein [Chryseobacterium sp. CKR4-1]
MSLKEKVVQGALCQCQFGTTPDTLKVLTQQKFFINDLNGSSKLAATHKDIGSTFEKNSFGSCKKKLNTPCVAVVTEWSGYYEKEKYSPPDGYVLLEDSKATCPIGGKDCISIIKTGQIGEPSKSNIKKADEELQSHVNPVINISQHDTQEFYKFGF